jgi:hypothetical protein
MRHEAVSVAATDMLLLLSTNAKMFSTVFDKPCCDLGCQGGIYESHLTISSFLLGRIDTGGLRVV